MYLSVLSFIGLHNEKNTSSAVIKSRLQRQKCWKDKFILWILWFSKWKLRFLLNKLIPYFPDGAHLWPIWHPFKILESTISAISASYIYSQDKKLNKFIKYLSQVTQNYILKSSDNLRFLDLSVLELTASNTPLYISVEPRTKIQYCANQSPKTNQYCHIRHVCSKLVDALADF